jgi:hypothetical protein
MAQYTTAEKVQAELQATSAFDTTTLPTLSQVTDWIEEESAQIDNDTNSAFSQITETIVLDYNGEEVIPLKGSPIISVSQFLYDTNTLGNSAGAAWIAQTEGSQYSVYNDRGEILLLLNNFTPKEGFKKFTIEYVHGYATTPAIVQKLATKKVALRILNTLIAKNINERNDGGSTSVGSISIIEPVSYGVGSYKQLKEDIHELEKSISKTDGIYRYDIYTE